MFGPEISRQEINCGITDIADVSFLDDNFKTATSCLAFAAHLDPNQRFKPKGSSMVRGRFTRENQAGDL